MTQTCSVAQTMRVRPGIPGEEEAGHCGKYRSGKLCERFALNITAPAVYSNRVAGAGDRNSRGNGGLTSGCAGVRSVPVGNPFLMGLFKTGGCGLQGGSGGTLRSVLAGGASVNVLRLQRHADDPYGP